LRKYSSVLTEGVALLSVQQHGACLKVLFVLTTAYCRSVAGRYLAGVTSWELRPVRQLKEEPCIHAMKQNKTLLLC
jgi:hypothetical protein